jgi:hypothetical protein
MNIDCRRLLLVAGLFLLFSCSREKAPAGGTEGPSSLQKNSAAATSSSQSTSGNARYSLELYPSAPTRNSTLSINPRGFSPYDARVQWFVNGNPAGDAAPVFKAALARRGDRVQAKATVRGMDFFSNTVEIRNTPPELTKVKIMPEIFKPGDVLRVDVTGSDPDGDEVTFLYEWKKNGEPAGKGPAIESDVKRGDRISVKINPFDGTVNGVPIILEREIVNMPPVIADEKKIKFDGKTATCQMKASDPDGDPLAYSLKAAPQGMTIDPSTGLITWDVPRNFRGKVPVAVCVKDGHGGEATHTFDIDIHL